MRLPGIVKICGTVLRISHWKRFL